MSPKKFRWSKVYESSEEELIELLAAQDISAERFAAEEFHVFGKQQFKENTTLWCAEGSFTLFFAEKKFSMQPGDGIHIPASLEYGATAGMSGCAYYEAAI